MDKYTAREVDRLGAALLIMAGTFLALFIAVLFGLFVWVGSARAHEAPSGWTYPLHCCSNKDCTEIDASRVKEGPEGYRVTLLPGDHDFVKAQTSFLIPYAQAKPSPDGVYHICLSPALAMLCFFAGSRSY